MIICMIFMVVVVHLVQFQGGVAFSKDLKPEYIAVDAEINHQIQRK